MPSGGDTVIVLKLYGRDRARLHLRPRLVPAAHGQHRPGQRHRPGGGGGRRHRPAGHRGTRHDHPRGTNRPGGHRRARPGALRRTAARLRRGPGPRPAGDAPARFRYAPKLTLGPSVGTASRRSRPSYPAPLQRLTESTPMHALVTGAAGFIGSHLAERLLADGHDVIGDRLLHRLLRRRAQARQRSPRSRPTRRHFVEADLLTADLDRAARGRRRRLPPGGPAGRAPLVGRALRRLRPAQRPGHPAAARGGRTAGHRSLRLRLQLLGLRQRRALPDHRDRPPPARSAPTA